MKAQPQHQKMSKLQRRAKRGGPAYWYQNSHNQVVSLGAVLQGKSGATQVPPFMTARLRKSPHLRHRHAADEHAI
jgi:hypothetical protein